MSEPKKRLEHSDLVNMDIVYDDAEHEPQLHVCTWVALAAMWLYNFVIVFVLLSPPQVLSYIGSSLNAAHEQAWVLSALTLPQAVLAPLFSSTSDVFQIRKMLMVVTITFSFIGAAIGPGHKWNIAEEVETDYRALARADPENGRRKFWWIQVALFGASGIGIVIGYRQPKRHTRLDQLVIFAAGIAGIATFQPDDATRALVFAGLSGIGFAALIILIVAAVQLSMPHHLIATATAVTVSSRSVAASIFTAIYVATFSGRLKGKLPTYVGSAALETDLPIDSLQAFVAAIAGNDANGLGLIEWVNPEVISAGVAAAKHATADSIRIVFIIGAPFGVAAAISCWYIADMKKTMNYKVDAPMEPLTKKVQEEHKDSTSAA